jgi:hypothetical protein
MTTNKALNFPINNKVYTVNIGDDIDNKIENGIKKFLNLDKNLSTQDILLAYIQKTHELVEIEKSLEKLSFDISQNTN